MNAITVLDTSVGENGPTQTIDLHVLAKDKPFKFVAEIGAGDTYVVQGRASTSSGWVTIYSFSSSEWKEIYLAPQWRVIRSVDGGADGTVKVINTLNVEIVAHEA